MPDSGKTREEVLKELAELRQAKLRQLEERFSKVFKSSPVSMAIVNQADGKYIDVNNTWQNVTGYSRDEIIGQNWLELGIFNIKDIHESKQILNEHGSVSNREIKYKTKSGKIRYGL